MDYNIKCFFCNEDFSQKNPCMQTGCSHYMCQNCESQISYEPVDNEHKSQNITDEQISQQDQQQNEQKNQISSEKSQEKFKICPVSNCKKKYFKAEKNIKNMQKIEKFNLLKILISAKYQCTCDDQFPLKYMCYSCNSLFCASCFLKHCKHPDDVQQISQNQLNEMIIEQLEIFDKAIQDQQEYSKQMHQIFDQDIIQEKEIKQLCQDGIQYMNKQHYKDVKLKKHLFLDKIPNVNLIPDQSKIIQELDQLKQESKQDKIMIDTLQKKVDELNQKSDDKDQLLNQKLDQIKIQNETLQQKVQEKDQQIQQQYQQIINLNNQNKQSSDKIVQLIDNQIKLNNTFSQQFEKYWDLAYLTQCTSKIINKKTISKLEIKFAYSRNNSFNVYSMLAGAIIDNYNMNVIILKCGTDLIYIFKDNLSVMKYNDSFNNQGQYYMCSNTYIGKSVMKAIQGYAFSYCCNYYAFFCHAASGSCYSHNGSNQCISIYTNYIYAAFSSSSYLQYVSGDNLMDKNLFKLVASRTDGNQKDFEIIGLSIQLDA